MSDKTLTCPSCKRTDQITGVQYRLTAEDYDGVSEWNCVCGCRWGRWTGKVLLPGDIERRYGRTS